MTSPRVIELPRRLEPVGRDTFLGAAETDAARPVSYVGNVVALRSRDGRGLRRPAGEPAPPAAA
jgi:hypothetical protein